jgi:prepilin-type N-terminal cleavage/methylation domain-containing protein
VRSRAGFTLIELGIVVLVGAIVVTLGSLTFSGYFQRNAARRAAQVFAQDLVAARNYAVRTQETVVVRFFEGTQRYEVEGVSTGTEVASRRFSGSSADIELSAITLEVAGDSLVVSSRGILDMSGFGGSLGQATFSSGAVVYTVSFNGMGASKIDKT